MKRILLILLLLSSCSPDTYLLNVSSQNPLFGKILTGYGTAETTSGNSILLRSGGITAIRRYSLTQYTAHFTTEIKKGDGLVFHFRTAPNNFESQKSIKFEFSTDGCKITESGSESIFIDSVKAKRNIPYLIKIFNDGKFAKVSVDCADIHFSATNIPSTEWVLIEALKDSEILLYGIEYLPLAEDGAIP